MTKAKQADKKITNEKPISLAGVDFKELMKAFLKIEPDKKTEEKKKPAN